MHYPNYLPPFFLAILLFLSSNAFAGFTSYPTCADTDGEYALTWSRPPASQIEPHWVNEHAGGGTPKGVTCGGTSVELSGRTNGTYTNDLWYETKRIGPRGSESIYANVKQQSITVTVSIQVTAPSVRSAQVTPTTSASDCYTVSWLAISNAETYTLREHPSKNGEVV